MQLAPQTCLGLRQAYWTQTRGSPSHSGAKGVSSLRQDPRTGHTRHQTGVPGQGHFPTWKRKLLFKFLFPSLLLTPQVFQGGLPTAAPFCKPQGRLRSSPEPG